MAFSLACVSPYRRSLYENEPAARSGALVCGVTAIQERPYSSTSHLWETAGPDGELISTSGSWSQAFSVGKVKGWEDFGLKISDCSVPAVLAKERI